MKAQNDRGKLVKELEERNAVIKTVLQNIPVGIAVNKIDDGKVTVVNKRFSEIYGWTADDLTDIAGFFSKMYPDEAYRKEIMGRLMNDIQSGDPARMSWNGITITTQAGEKRVVNLKNIPLDDQNLMISTVLDVTPEFNQATEIRRTKANYEALINGTQDSVWSVDTELRIITANHSFLEMVKTITGRHVKAGDSVLVEVFDKEQLAKWQLYYERALKGERFTIKDQYYDPVKRTVEYSLISLSPMFNEENVLFGVACYSKDITRDTLNLLALEKTKADLEKIMDSSLDMICSIDANGCILSISAASETILGYRPDELIGKQLFDFIYPEDKEKTEQAAAHVMIGHSLTNTENRYVRKDGSIVPLIWSARWDPKDKIRYGIARDATETKKSEAVIVESEKIYKYLFNKNPLPIFIWDQATLRIIDCNEQAISKYGYTREEFLQLTLQELGQFDGVQPLKEVVEAEAPHRGPGENIWIHKKKNGELMYMDITGQLMDFKGKRVAMGIANEVTESRYYLELDKLEKNILEMSAKNDKSLSEIIEIYLLGVETLHPGMLCSMQEKRDNRLYNLSSPSLPAEYLEVIRGIKIGNNTGSCGTSAFLKQKVIVTDISNDVRWADYKEIAAKYQLKTCWSYPILDRKDNVLATFACYYKEIKYPAEREENTIKRAGHILQTILESYQREHALKISNERFERAAEATSEVIWDWNLETNGVYYSGNMQKLFGHKSGVKYNNLPFYFEYVHPDDRERVALHTDQVKSGAMINWTEEYRFKKANGDYAFVLDKGIVIRDENGVGIRMIGAMQDITSAKLNEMRINRQNERLTEIALINAHEIRRPVATILGLMQLIDKETIVDETGRDILKHLGTVTEELDTVIRRIIDKAEC